MTIWSFRWSPRSLWIQRGGTTPSNHLGAVALPWQEARAPRGATDGSYDAKRRRPPTIDRRDECSPRRHRARARARPLRRRPTDRRSPNAGDQRWAGRPSGGRAVERRRVAASAWCLAPRRCRQQHTIGFVLFFGPPGHEKGNNPISRGLGPVRREHMAVERERTGWNSIPCLADVGHAKRKIKINVFPVSIHQNTLKYQIKLDKRKIK